MPLNLNEFKPAEDELIYDGLTLKVKADIPRNILNIYKGIEDEKDTDIIMQKTEEWITAVLKMHNDNDTVEQFMSKIKDSTALMSKTATFISELITRTEEKKTS